MGLKLPFGLLSADLNLSFPSISERLECFSLSKDAGLDL